MAVIDRYVKLYIAAIQGQVKLLKSRHSSSLGFPSLSANLQIAQAMLAGETSGVRFFRYTAPRSKLDAGRGVMHCWYPDR